MKILICDPVSPKGIALLQQRPKSEVVVLQKKLSEAEQPPLVKDVSAMVVRSETKVTKKAVFTRAALSTDGRTKSKFVSVPTVWDFEPIDDAGQRSSCF